MLKSVALDSKREFILLAVVMPVIVVLGLAVLSGCGNPSNPNSGRTAPGGGMTIQTFYQEGGSLPVAIGYVNLLGNYVKDIGFNIYYPAGSDYSSFDIYTGISNATWTNTNKRTPAIWSLTWTDKGTHPECAQYLLANQQDIVFPIAYGIFTLTCVPPKSNEQARISEGGSSGNTTAKISPSVINLNYPPSTLTVTGSGFSSQYGNPIVQFFDSNGAWVEEMDPSSVSSTSLTVPADWSGFLTGKYTFVVLNIDTSGNYYAIAAGPMSATCVGVCD